MSRHLLQTRLLLANDVDPLPVNLVVHVLRGSEQVSSAPGQCDSASTHIIGKQPQHGCASVT